MSNINELIDEIYVRRNLDLETDIERYPRENMRLSDIPDCERQLVYGVLNWKERALFTTEVMARLREGKEQERKIVTELMKLGFEISLSQLPVEVKGIGGIMLARGHIDGFIDYEGGRYPIEIKSMNPNVYNGIKSLDDLRGKPYLRKYIRQLLMYLFGNNLEQGLFILTDCLGHWKLIPIYLDLGECEYILQLMERAYKHIQAKTYPDRIMYDPGQCGMCGFSVTCLHDIINRPAELIDNPEFEENLNRLHELKPASKEYDDIYKKVKSAMTGVDKVICGNYLLQNLPSQRTTYEVPDEIKKEYAVKKPVSRLVIEIIGGKK